MVGATARRRRSIRRFIAKKEKKGEGCVTGWSPVHKPTMPATLAFQSLVRR
jgi:hypothetical protein